MTSVLLPDLSRRAFLSAAGLAGVSALTGPAVDAVGATSVEFVHGRVVEILPSGLRRALADVMISNGRDVVTTDAAGRWIVPVRPLDLVFMIKPAGYTYTTADGDRTSGVPEFWFDPARDGSRTPVEFQLRPSPEPDRFDVMLCADTQPANALELNYVRDELNRVVDPAAVAFAIHHGDCVGDDLALLSSYRNVVAETGLIWHHCPGNHDIDPDAATTGRPFKTWQRVMGPAHYAFKAGRATFLILNNVSFDAAAANAGDARPYRGTIGSEQVTFVKNVLKHTPRDALIVVSMHIPLASYGNPDSPADNTGDTAALLHALQSHPHAVSFSGHAHATEHHYLNSARSAGSSAHHHHVLTAFCGSWWGGPKGDSGIPCADSCDGSPRGYHILSIDGNRYTSRFIACVGQPERQYRALTVDRSGAIKVIDGSVDFDLSERNDGLFLVNVFDGGPRTCVSLVSNNSDETIDLQRTAIADPIIQRLFSAHPQTLKPWVTAVPSSHIWTVALPRQQMGVSTGWRVRVSGEYADQLASLDQSIAI